MVDEPKDGKVVYHFKDIERQYQFTYPEKFFNNQKYCEQTSNGVFIMKDE